MENININYVLINIKHGLTNEVFGRKIYEVQTSENVRGVIVLVAGPCALENLELGFQIAEFVKSRGATVFRAGCYKGQNRPIVNGEPEYLGMGDEGVKILSDIQSTLSIPCLTDMQSVRQAEVLKKYKIAYPQVGARNMDSLELLRQFRKIFNKSDAKAIVLKRGPSATVDEWLGAAEHLGGPDKVILCERGIASFDRTPTTRWRLDFVGIAYVKQHTGYRVIVDPSHGSGDNTLVYTLSKAALAIADGIMVEVHPHPDLSPTDANQTIAYHQFIDLVELYKSDRSEDVRTMTNIVTYPLGKAYAWQIEKRLGLPSNSIFNLKLTTNRFAAFLEREAGILSREPTDENGSDNGKI